MNRYMVKNTIEAVSVVEDKEEEKVEKDFNNFLRMICEELEKKYPGTKFKVNYLCQVIELPKVVIEI